MGFHVSQFTVVALIYFTDQQAMSLLRLYVTLSIATVSGAAAGFSGMSSIPLTAAWALLASTIVFVIGAALAANNRD